MFDVSLSLKRAQESSDQIQEWWIVDELKPGPIMIEGEKQEAGLHIYVFSDQVSPPSLGFLAGYGYVLIDQRVPIQVFGSTASSNIRKVTLELGSRTV